MGRKTELGNVEFVFADGELVVRVLESKTLESFLRGEDRGIGGGNSRSNERKGGGFVVGTESKKGGETGGIVEE